MKTVLVTKMGNLVFKPRRWALKIPVSARAIKESLREKIKRIEAMTDSLYGKYISRYRYFGPILFMDTLAPISNESLVQDFFTKAFLGSTSWEPRPLNQLLEERWIRSFLHAHAKGSIDYWSAALNSLTLPGSSQHGDLHRDNMGTKDGRLFFIDWGTYRAVGCRYFDAIDYCIYHSGQSWTLALFEKNTEPLVQKLIGHPLPKNGIPGYCLARMSKELRELQERNAMTPSKILKYLSCFERCRAYIENN